MTLAQLQSQRATLAQQVAQASASVSALTAQIATLDTQIKTAIAAASPHAVYVSSAGDDAADGRTPSTAIKTWARACALATGDQLNLCFRRGDTFPVDRSMGLHGDAIHVGSYGDDGTAKPILSLAVQRDDVVCFALTATNATVEDLTFDSSVCQPSNFDKRNVAVAVQAEGRAIAVKNCTFLNVMCGVITQSNARVDGMLVDHCDAPLDTGLRAYFVFAGGGSDWTVSNCRAVNSTREHTGVRGGVDGLIVVNNDFGQLDRRNVDPDDFAKSTLNIQLGQRVVIRGNIFRGGPMSVGPLGGGNGLPFKANRVTDVTIENNRVLGSQIQIQHGTSGVTIANNLIAVDDAPAIAVYAYDPTYGRGVTNVTISGNTATCASAHGNFASIGAGAINVSLARNVYVAPKLETGGYDTSPLSLGETKSLASVAGNRWPVPAKQGWGTNGGVMLIGGQYVPPAAWAALAPTDKTLAIPAGTVALDGAGVDESTLPAVPR